MFMCLCLYMLITYRYYNTINILIEYSMTSSASVNNYIIVIIIKYNL